MAEQQKSIPIGALSLEELMNIRQRTEAEVEQLSVSLEALNMAAEKFADAKDALNVLTPASKGKEVLVPLTSSLYVPGVLDDTEHVTLSVGANYYVKKPIKGAQDYFDRRTVELQGQMEQIAKILQGKQQLLNALMDTMRAKISAQRQ
eukprot:TRINITY_DN4404_c0_g1_i1.p1 TRINITY_DN4404_c0_g1~~TRINITY_DN4404_c0_g1_i1.p1  ORF type:complete len:169 (-),score=75.21 TRINITY_DN4404_c0_g1_i1:60-503(-)